MLNVPSRKRLYSDLGPLHNWIQDQTRKSSCFSKPNRISYINHHAQARPDQQSLVEMEQNTSDGKLTSFINFFHNIINNANEQ